MKLKSRKYQLVINNPKDHNMNHDNIKSIIRKIAQVIYWCMSDEIGLETQTYHTHIFIQFQNEVQISTIKKYFPMAHIEIAKATPFENRNYIFKLGKWENDPKNHTKIEGTQEEFGTIPQGKSTQKYFDTLLSMVVEGKDDWEIINANPSYMLHLNRVRELRNLQREKEFKTKRRLDLEVHYVWGDSRSGKSRTIRDTYGDENVYSIDNYLHPFDGYEGQDVIVFEEFRSDLPLKNMLKYLDVYPLSLPSRYHDKVACYTKVYIVSNIPFESQFPTIRTSEPKSWDAFANRIKDIAHYKKESDGTITIETITMDEYKKKLHPFKH